MYQTINKYMARLSISTEAIFQLPDLFTNPAQRREKQITLAAVRFLKEDLPSGEFVHLAEVRPSDDPNVVIFAEPSFPDYLFPNFMLGVD